MKRPATQHPAVVNDKLSERARRMGGAVSHQMPGINNAARGFGADDEVFFHVNGAPRSGRIVGHGRDGCTVDEPCGARHQVAWHRVLGLKGRKTYSAKVVDRGEGGAIMEREDGSRFWVSGSVPESVEPETLADDELLHKSDALARFAEGVALLAVPATRWSGFLKGNTHHDPKTGRFARVGAVSVHGPFGPVFSGFTHQPEKAIAKLMAERRGEVADAFIHPELGRIAFVYGDERMGLRHIAEKHLDTLAQLPAILRSGTVVRDESNLPRAYIVATSTKPAQLAVIRLQWNGADKTWLMTAYQDDKGRFGEWSPDERRGVIPSPTTHDSVPVVGRNVGAGPIDVTKNAQADQSSQSPAYKRQRSGKR